MERLRTETRSVTPLLPDPARAGRSHARIAWERFRRHRLAMIGLVILGVLTLLAVLAPVIAPYGPDEQDLFSITTPPSREHWLGTDELGRDVLTRVMYGGRVSLSVGLAAALISTLIGVVVGAVAGFYGRWVDAALMRFIDLMLAFPALFFLLVLFTIVSASVWNVILFLGLFGWMWLARVIRGEILALKELDFIDAAHAMGATNVRIIVQHLLPNVTAAIIVSTTLSMAYNMIAEATLDFLGFGVPPNVPTWGNMLTGASNYYIQVPLLPVAPGAVLVL
ncbi:MAG: ABC transporter permease, partial [Sphaerobacter thermophilus]|uniref:ABC transporter permease n=1 Tax=Sphaerobacter thermophilus TaxID=2057 RepID=UPI00396D67B0